jgi:hypothetical protein
MIYKSIEKYINNPNIIVIITNKDAPILLTYKDVKTAEIALNYFLDNSNYENDKNFREWLDSIIIAADLEYMLGINNKN